MNGRWYWKPTSKLEREARKERGERVEIPLGKAGSVEARKRWAELSGYRAAQIETGTVSEILGLFERHGLDKKPNGKPRSEATKRDYKYSIRKVLMPRFGTCRYGRTEHDASRGQAIGVVDVQKFVADDGRTAGNRHLSCLSAAFSFAIRRGLTTYNPCIGVARNAEEPRERVAEEWEAEVLRTVAPPLLGLLMRFEAICGWRISDILRVQPAQLTAAGVRLRQGKRGKRQLWEWSPELHAIINEAKLLPGVTPIRVEDRYVFHTRKGRKLSLSGFESMWQRTLKRANRLLAECDIPLKIEDLHFHDLRAKAGDDAEEAGMDRAAFLGDSEATAERHYARRETRLKPLK